MSASDGTSPSHSQLNTLLTYYQSGQYSDCQKLALKITKKFPNHQFAWKVLGAIFGQSGKINDALIANKKAVKINPHDAEAHYNLGVTLKELGRLEDAEESYRQAISVKPDYAEAYNNLGVTLKNLGRLEDAQASYKQAIAVKPDYAEAYNSLGVTLKELGKLREAESSYRQSIALKPRYAKAYNNLGNTLKALGRVEESESSYGQAIELEPDYTDALLNRWKLLFDKKEFKSALRDADACSTKKSRMHSLETLFALGKIEEIYKRIENQLEIDDENIRIAAFSAFISKMEEKETAHKFCNKPLEFMQFGNISSHLEDLDLFLAELIGELQELKTIWEPTGYTTRNGFQTPSLIEMNLFSNKSIKIQRLKSIIFDELDLYHRKFGNNSCSYIQKWPSEKVLFGWQVILKNQGYQLAHIHPSGWLSGVIYLQVVPSLGRDEGAIEFSLNGDNFWSGNSPKITYQPKVGDIVFFPSSLHHRTIPFTTEMDRIIISFDLLPISTTS